jgi:hypothetical protein
MLPPVGGQGSATPVGVAPGSPSGGEPARSGLEQRVASLEKQVAELQKVIAALRGAKGVTGVKEKAMMKTFRLEKTKGSEVAKIIEDTFRFSPNGLQAINLSGPNSIIVYGTAKSLDQVGALISKLEIQKRPAPKLPEKKPRVTLHTLNLSHASGAEVVVAIQNLLKDRDLRVATVAGGKGLLIYGTEEDHKLVLQMVDQMEHIAAEAAKQAEIRGELQKKKELDRIRVK